MMEVHPTQQALPSRAVAATQCYGVGSQQAVGESGTVSLLRSALLVFCALVLCVLTVWEGVRVGADRTMPGALARHKNAFAVAISCLAYGHCRGYTSLRSVDQALHDGGLSYEMYGRNPDFYHDAGLINVALERAASIADPGVAVNSMGPHEKGLALFYTFSMAVFGIELSSLFYGFMLVFVVTVGLFSVAFHRDRLAMAGLVAACCAMYLIVPVVQGLTPDVNAVHGSRYLPLLAIVPVLHLLMLFERGETGPMQAVIAAGQASVLFFVMFSRLSGVWMVAGLAMWIAGRVAMSMLANDRPRVRMIAFRAIVPGALVGFVLAALIVYPKLALDPQYLKQDETEYRTFWHHLLVAAHFNPARTEVAGVPAHFPGFADQIAYDLFEEEIARRGETLSQYLDDDEAGWPQRTTSRQYDYKWGLYEAVVKGVFLRLVAEHPLYVLQSFFFYEPLAIVTDLFTGQFVPPAGALIVVAAASAICVLALFGGAHVAGSAALAWAALMFLAMSLLPALASGVMPLRLVEPAFLLYAGGSLAGILFLPRLVLVLVGWLRRKRPVPI
jgi:type IV secretory pathway TrbD component